MFLFKFVNEATATVAEDDFWADNLWDAITSFQLRYRGAHILSVSRFA